MGKTTTIIIGGALAGFAVYLFAKAQAVKNLVIAPGNILNIGFVGGLPVVTASLSASNTNTLAVTINSLAGNLYANGTLIGSVYNFIPFYVPANAQAWAQVNFQMQPVGIVNDLITSFTYGSIAQEISFEGFANVGLIQGDQSKDANEIYLKLERVILPLYYGLPFAYAEVMRSAIALNGSFFNTQRMVESCAKPVTSHPRWIGTASSETQSAKMRSMRFCHSASV